MPSASYRHALWGQDRHLDPPAGRVARDQPRTLRTAQTSHLLDVAPHQAPRSLAQQGVLLPDKNPLYPSVELPAVLGLKPDFLARRHKTAN